MDLKGFYIYAPASSQPVSLSLFKKEFKVKYSISGMTDMLHRLNYSYKKPKLAPGKADANAQEEFVEFYKELRGIKLGFVLAKYLY